MYKKNHERKKVYMSKVKPKKIQPEHTHGVGEESIEPCPLCATHGDVWNPGLTECRFIGQEINVDP